MSLVATWIDKIVANSQNLDKNESLRGDYGAFDLFVQQSKSNNGILSEELKAKARTSMGSALKVPVIQYNGDVSVSSSRSCTITGAPNTSAMVTASFSTLSVGIQWVPAGYDNNYIDEERDFARMYRDAITALLTSLDTKALTALSSNKTQVFNDPLLYAVNSNVLEPTWGMREDFLGDLSPIMRANKYRGGLHIVGNVGVESLVQKLAQKDIYNAVNKRNEWAGKVFHFTTQLSNESGKYATGYAVEDGNVGILTRTDREANRGSKSGTHEWWNQYIPELGFEVGMHYYEEVGSAASTHGDATADMVCNVKKYLAISFDIAFLTAYNSAQSTIPSPIAKFAIGTSAATNPFAQDVNIVGGNVGLASGATVLIGNTTSNPVNTKEVPEE